MTKIIRDKKNVIIDELHKTIPILTKYEKTRILGERTKQINNGSKPFIDVENDILEGVMSAQKEFNIRSTPSFIINGVLYSGNKSIKEFRQIIDKILSQ